MHRGQKSEDAARAGEEQELQSTQPDPHLGASGHFCYFILGVGEALVMEESQSKMSV